MFWKTFSTLLLLSLVALPGARSEYLQWTMLDIGNGDANYIKLPNGKDVVIDGGKPDDGPAVFKPFLENLTGFDGVIDYMVATHADADHYGGLEELLNSYQVNKVYSPRGHDGTHFNDHFAVPVVSEGCPWIVKGAADGEASGGVNPGTFDIGCYLDWDPEVTVRCLSVGSGSTTNRNSIVLKMDFGDSSFIFTGDLSGDAVINNILNNYGSDVPSDIHKISHHGSVSDGCNKASWINAVHSENSGYSFISCIGSEYHPKPECLDRLMANGTVIYMTFLDGDITVKADDEGNYNVIREKVWDGTFQDPNPTDRAAYPPEIPAGLVVTGSTANSVTLDWDDVSVDSNGGVIPSASVKYDVFRAEVSGGDTGAGSDPQPDMAGGCGIYRKITSEPLSSSTYIDGTVASGKNYFYRVSALRTDYYYERRYSGECAATTGNPLIESGDYDGDGTDDIAVFRSGSGLWAVRGVTRAYFGSSSDAPACGDYEGDGSTEIAVFRPAYGLWAIRGVSRLYYGSPSDRPVPGDYDGDGSCEAGIFRASTGLWAIRGVTRVYFGSSSDELAPGYFDGEGRKNIGIYRPVSGLWAIRGLTRVYFGSPGDELVPGDYDGSGAWAFGIYRSTSGLWAIRGVTRCYFGSGSDDPLPADYSGNGTDDFGMFRDSSGLWAIRGLTRAYYGGSGDIPVTR